MDEEDRISQLPDAILQHIISFINIKQAVQTSILSSRWQNLWLSLSDLDFNFNSLAIHGGVNLKNSQATRDFSIVFTNFIEGFLSRRDGTSTIRKFHLSMDENSYCFGASESEATLVEKCVDYAVNHGVKELHLDAYCLSYMRFPAGIFGSKTLRELKLGQSGCSIRIPKQFSIPHLKTLHLELAIFIDDDGFDSFSLEPFSSFPELENLTLRRCRFNGIVIFCLSLVNLEISHHEESFVHVEEISTPALTSFKYEGFFPLSLSIVNLPVLDKAYVNIVRNHRFKRNKLITSKCNSLLQQLGNAKNVTLTLDTIKALELDPGVIEQSPSPFPNMECLKLRKGRREFPTVPQRVMNYLTKGCLCGDSLVIEFSEGVSVVEKGHVYDLFDEDGDAPILEHIFQMEDEI